jgi:hypothetical protein
LSFLNPLILFGLVAASLPILIHLFTRTKSRTIPFSTLDFLKKIQNEQVRRIKLRQILLLILRTLIIILIILVFARPTFEDSASAASSSNAKTSMAIIVDNSISMQRPFNGNSMYNEMLQRARSVAELLRPGDEAFLITTTDSSLAISRRSFHYPKILQSAINDLSTRFSPTNIDAAIKLASNLLARSSNINREIYLLSDMQRNAFSHDSLTVAENSRLYLWPSITKDISNLSIIDAKIVSTILQRGKLAEAAVNVHNTGDVAIENALVQLFVDDRRVAQTTLQLAPGEATTKLFRFVLESSGFSEAKLQLEDDDLLQDNTATFTFYVPEKLTVGMVGQDADLFNITLAVAAEEGESNFQLQTIPQARLRSTVLNDFDLFVLSNSADYDRQFFEQLADFVKDGGGLFLTLGDNLDIRAFNSTMAKIFQLPKIVDVLGSTDGSEGSLSLDKYDATHPLFSGIFQSNDAEFTKPEFKFAVKVLLNENIHSIMQYSSGDPFLFERKLGRGKVIVMTTSLDERLTDLSRRTIFAPLMTRIMAYGGSVNPNDSPSLLVGDEIRYKLSAQDVSCDIEIKRPDEKYDRLKPAMTPNGAWIYYSLTNLPGVYELVADGDVQFKWSVQIDANELDMAPLTLRELKKIDAAIVLEENMNLSENIASLRHGRELWLYFALAAFFLLVGEMLLYREKGEVPVE